MLRAGYGAGNIDPQFERSAKECTRLGIPFGVYWFSYAYTPEMARREAEYCAEAVRGYSLAYPAAWDFEYDSVDFALERGVAVTKELASAMAREFCGEIRRRGLYPMLYANPNYLAQYFDGDLPEEVDIWLAKWPRDPDPAVEPELSGGMWQYSSSGQVEGISGRVDLDAAYRDYPAITAGGGNMDGYAAEAEKAREWVMERGISDGERPLDKVTREELWVMLYGWREILMINWRVRFANKSFWLSFIPALLLLVQVVAALFGFELELEGAAARLLDVVNALFAVLALLGVVNDPTTAGRRTASGPWATKSPRRAENDGMGRRGRAYRPRGLRGDGCDAPHQAQHHHDAPRRAGGGAFGQARRARARGLRRPRRAQRA